MFSFKSLTFLIRTVVIRVSLYLFNCFGVDEFDERQQQQPWPRPSLPAEIHTTATQISDHQHHGEDDGDHHQKKSVLQKVKDKAKKLIKKKKKKPDHGHGDELREQEDHHHFEEQEGEEEDDDDSEEEEEERNARDFNPLDLIHSRPCKNFLILPC